MLLKMLRLMAWPLKTLMMESTSNYKNYTNKMLLLDKAFVLLLVVKVLTYEF